MKNMWAPLLSGLLFSLGLGVAGMTEPQNILNFLNIDLRTWSFDLLWVMGGAILVYATLRLLILQKAHPMFEKKFPPAISQKIDDKLIIGALFFGVGWGMTGLCPGPTLVAAFSFNSTAILTLVSMLIGMATARRVMKRYG